MAEQVFKCPHCDYVAKKEGYLRQHVQLKHGTAEKNNKKTGKDESSLCECGGQFRLLNSRNLAEKQAIATGFKKVCKKCLELSE